MGNHSKNDTDFQDASSRSSQILRPGKDFYIDNNGLMVFTSEYHLSRGFCCKHSCVHCPYGFDPDKSG